MLLIFVFVLPILSYDYASFIKIHLIPKLGIKKPQKKTTLILNLFLFPVKRINIDENITFKVVIKQNHFIMYIIFFLLINDLKIFFLNTEYCF